MMSPEVANNAHDKIELGSQKVIHYDESQVDENAMFIVDTLRSRRSAGVYEGINTEQQHQDLMSIFGVPEAQPACHAGPEA